MAKQKKNLLPASNILRNFKCITSSQDVGEVANILARQPEFAIDFETTGLNIDKAQVHGIALATDDQEWYITHGARLAMFPYLAQLATPDRQFIMHNSLYDLHFLNRYGIRPPNIFDTMIGQFMVDENQSIGLKSLAETKLGVTEPLPDFNDLRSLGKELTGKRILDEVTIYDFPLDMLAQYAGRDGRLTMDLKKRTVFELNKEGMTDMFYQTEMPFVYVLMDIEEAGFYIDQRLLNQLGIDFAVKRDEALAKWNELTGGINPGSNEQLVEYLFTSKRYKPTLFTKTGAAQVDALALSRLKEHDKNGEITTLLVYRQYEKLLGTYVDRFSQDLFNGRIKGKFNPTGCIVGDSLVPTTKGVFRIEQLANTQDGIAEHTDIQIVNRYGIVENASHVIMYKNRDTIKITTSLGLSIEGTENHPVISNEYDKVDTSANKNSCRTLGRFDTAEIWKRLDHIKVGDYVKVPIGFHLFSKEYIQLPAFSQTERTNAKHIHFPTYVSEDLAEFLGMYFADGSIHANNGTYSIRITNRNTDVQNRIIELSLKLFGIQAHIINPNFGVSITSIGLQNFFEYLKLQRGSINKTIPDFILQSPESVVAAFIKGMTLDSTVVEDEEKVYLKMTVANKETMSTVQQLLLNMGIVSSAREDKTSTNTFMLCILNDMLSLFNNTIGFVESCKVVTVPLTHKKKKNNYRVSPDGKSIWVLVKKIEYGKSDVFDFTVPGTHSFVSNGIISHNTVTGRLSSSDPNLQNIPSKGETGAQVRSLFSTPEGRTFIDVDYSQLELRLTAHYSKDPNMLRVFAEGGDPHQLTADLMGVQRYIGKTLNFAVLYGAGPRKLGDTIEKSGKPRPNLAEAKEWLQKFDIAYPTIANWKNRVVQYARELGYVKTIAGRKRRLPEITARDEGLRMGAERQAVNSVIQGSAADVCKRAMLRVHPLLKQFDAMMLAQVHDEIVAESPSAVAEECGNTISRVMTESGMSFNLRVNLVAEAHTGKDWASTH